MLIVFLYTAEAEKKENLDIYCQHPCLFIQKIVSFSQYISLVYVLIMLEYHVFRQFSMSLKFLHILHTEALTVFLLTIL